MPELLDLGCGEGKLLRELLRDRRFVRVAGADVSPRALERAAKRLELDRMPPRQRDRLHLFQGSVTYRDQHFSGYDAACLMEVVEHLDPPRLRALERVVFEHAAPATVVVTTPNREYNALFEDLEEHHLRLGLEGLHRFVEGEPLYRVHECAFGVLALESEPVDPRL